MCMTALMNLLKSRMRVSNVISYDRYVILFMLGMLIFLLGMLILLLGMLILFLTLQLNLHRLAQRMSSFLSLLVPRVSYCPRGRV